jgi:hypothetical protein
MVGRYWGMAFAALACWYMASISPPDGQSDEIMELMWNETSIDEV